MEDGKTMHCAIFLPSEASDLPAKVDFEKAPLQLFFFFFFS
jgi:hypothetical protein